MDAVIGTGADAAAVEAAIAGQGPPVTVHPSKGFRSTLRIAKLQLEEQRALAEARRRGYLVCRGDDSPDRLYDAWEALCTAERRPMVRGLARGLQASRIEIAAYTAGPRAALCRQDFGLLWGLLCAGADVVSGDPHWLLADGVLTAGLEALLEAAQRICDEIC